MYKIVHVVVFVLVHVLMCLFGNPNVIGHENMRHYTRIDEWVTRFSFKESFRKKIGIFFFLNIICKLQCIIHIVKSLVYRAQLFSRIVVNIFEFTFFEFPFSFSTNEGESDRYLNIDRHNQKLQNLF